MKGALESKFATAEARAKEESSAIKDILKSLAGNVDKLSAKVEKLEVKSAALASADSAPPETSKRSLFSTAVAVVAAKKMAMPAKSKNDESTRMTKRPDTKRQAEKEAEEVLDPLMIGDYVVLKSTEGFAKGGLVTGDLSFLRLGKLTCTRQYCVFQRSSCRPRSPVMTPLWHAHFLLLLAGVQKQAPFNEHREPLDYDTSVFRIVPMLGYRQVSSSSLPLSKPPRDAAPFLFSKISHKRALNPRSAQIK
jgi:hypothetical protein